jgi:hypothetical protein
VQVPLANCLVVVWTSVPGHIQNIPGRCSFQAFQQDAAISLFGVEKGTGTECRNINLIKKQIQSHERSHLN